MEHKKRDALVIFIAIPATGIEEIYLIRLGERTIFQNREFIILQNIRFFLKLLIIIFICNGKKLMSFTLSFLLLSNFFLFKPLGVGGADIESGLLGSCFGAFVVFSLEEVCGLLIGRDGARFSRAFFVLLSTICSGSGCDSMEAFSVASEPSLTSKKTFEAL